MGVDAAELVAQILVGLFIAMVLEFRQLVGALKGRAADIHSIADASARIAALAKFRYQSGVFIFYYGIPAFVTSIIALALCLNSVINDRNLSHGQAAIVRICLWFQFLFVMLVPLMILAHRCWRTLYPEKEITRLVAAIFALALLAIFAASGTILLS